MMAPGWQKMLVHKRISGISLKKRQKKARISRIKVDIKNDAIFKELGRVLAQTDGYVEIYMHLFHDMDQFDFFETSSVPDAKDFELIASDYEHIKLFDHTMNVFNETVSLLKADFKKNSQKDIYLLIALLHDFGKSNKLCEYYEVESRHNHWTRSAHYFKKILEIKKFDIDKTAANIILETLLSHHSILNEQKQDDLFIKSLKKADSAARFNELGKGV